MASKTTSQPEKPIVPVFPVKVEEPVLYSFSIIGADRTVPYFQFSDVFKTPSLRGLEALTFYEELEKRTTPAMYRDELDAEKILVRDISIALSGQQGKINLASAFESLADLRKILESREERLKFIIEPDIVWKLASIVYFDETENPNRYDLAYNLDVKIPFWKKNVKEEDFFLSKPMLTLMPHLSEYKENLPVHLQVTRMVRDLHQASLSSIKSNLF